jgi:hypothetical protein
MPQAGETALFPASRSETVWIAETGLTRGYRRAAARHDASDIRAHRASPRECRRGADLL